MRYPLLASAVTLVLGSAVALADDTTKSTDTSTPGTVEPVELFFKIDSAQLASQADAELQPLAKWAKCTRKHAIILESHADPTGTTAYNAKLAGERAAAVRQSLIAMGVPSNRIVVTVFGEAGPQRDSYAQDRRVTVKPMDEPVAAADLTPYEPPSKVIK